MSEDKVHWRKVFNSEYLGSCDLEMNQDLKAVIKSVSVKPVKDPNGKSKDCNVATFTDPALKPMILNATNCKVVKGFARSAYINDWNNIPIQIYIKGDVQAFGDITEGLRIRSTQPTVAKPKLIPGTPAWPNAIKALNAGEWTIEKIKTKYELSTEDEELLKSGIS